MYISVIIIFLMTVTFGLGCGSDSEPKLPESSKSYDQAATERNDEYGYKPVPKVEPVKGASILPENTISGTCSDAALKFAMAFTDLDSNAAFKICNDTVIALVRSIFLSPEQVAGMARAKANGFKINSVSTLTYPNDSTICTACIKAQMSGIESEDCSFKLKLIDGDWQIVDFGSPAE